MGILFDTAQNIGLDNEINALTKAPWQKHKQKR